MSPPASKIICPGCRAAFDATTNYCSRCGTSLQATPAEARVRATEPIAAAALPGGAPEASGALPRDGSEARDPLIGRVIDGRYRVLERIASGGMGVVYKVTHQRMGKVAAMKVLQRALARDREVMQRFRREAEAVSRLTHPNTVQVFDFGSADGNMYLVMEYVRGEDLGTLVSRDGPMAFKRAAPIFMQVCEALTEAHDVGIVHRDIKPENILVTHGREGHDHAKVLDFGLAKLSEPAEDSAGTTANGEIVGTPYYMSPEQIRGEELDGRSDLYALGAVMYRVLTGEPPFQAKSPMGVLTKHLHDAVVPPTARRKDLLIPQSVDRILLRAMAKDRADRHANAEELRADLDSALADLSSPGIRLGAVPLPDQSHPQPRLLREDFDAFERSLRWRAWGRLLLLPLAVGAAVTGTVLYVQAQRKLPRDLEAEPNNDLMSATLIAPDKAVRGRIGQRISPEEGDRDHYRLDLPREPVTLSAEVSAIPNINLTLVLFDENGNIVTIADRHPVGEGEALSERVTGKTVYLAVLERKGAARVPTENLSDEYTLTVRVAPAK